MACVRPEIVRSVVLLPAPFDADDRDDAAGRHGDAHALQRRHLLVVDGEIADLKQHRRGRDRLRSPPGRCAPPPALPSASVRPKFITVITSQRPITACMSCSTSMMVMPRSSRSWRTWPIMRRVSSEFMPVNGSSSRSSFGSAASATAMPSARWWPCGRLAVGSLRQPGEVEELQDLPGLPVGRALDVPIGADDAAEEARRARAVAADPHIVEHAELLEERGALEGADQARGGERAGPPARRRRAPS